jgi:LysM repeat protein
LDRNRFARYAAPAAFLAAVTIGVIVIRAGFEHGKHHANKPSTTTTTRTTTTHKHGHKQAHRRMYTIQSGDTLAAIAAANGTTVVALVHLNPGIDPQALRVGQKIRVK